ncbi:MAG TPA: hypothetical protein VE621_06680 [Bryobacteraceae bacterium]|nr:hypothetical protein [Bryobacteraceae bacterium]
MRRKLMVCALSAIALVAAAQGTKGSRKGPGILQPQMTVDQGTYEKPMAKIGETPSQPWSATTVAASVDGKPNPAKITTQVGEIVDFSCYLQVGKHGEKHRSCGSKCAQNGEPVGLLTKDGTLYMLMAEEHDPRRDGQTQAEFRKAMADHMAHIVEVTGTESGFAGYKAIYVHGYVKK